MKAADSQVLRMEILRRFKSREYENLISIGIQTPQQFRSVAWLEKRGLLEPHPERFLTDYRITEHGYETLAQIGGNVEAWEMAGA